RRVPAKRSKRCPSAPAPWATSAAPARANPSRRLPPRSSPRLCSPPSPNAARRVWTTRLPKRPWSGARRKGTSDMSLLGEIERNAPAVGDLGVLRFITAGSVDDGKSTLIGRLLHDTRAILQDQLAAVARASSKRGQEDIDLSLLTDGLEAEREQGITIDVAYRYFATPRRKFIIADTPGHEQYTRNMVTGASIADAAVILIDARK